MNVFQNESIVIQFIETVIDRYKQGNQRDKILFIGEIISIILSLFYLVYAILLPILQDLYYHDFYFNECAFIVVATITGLIFASIRLIATSLDNKMLGIKCSFIPIILYLMVALLSINSQRYITSHGLISPNNLVQVEFKHHCCGWLASNVDNCGAIPKTSTTCFERLVHPLNSFFKHNAIRCSFLCVFEMIIALCMYFFTKDDFIESQYEWTD
ncbi:hypothetical protein ENUP19_0361G0034 [Entamoeba nuttalli]|uniref:Tetraspanin family protein n=2 Tax=Entamoeba nuttalli TaxID=412467 RepID=K2HEU2_ENTNP|nr:hypothetical protein ENU1_060540 [Entamoeba nuttalli P19]EKE41304.1 hypothetical protein ENU1_060540 [Entamoeba nuttalli P19]|eukprot:XP_008856362.1 hypothetical protein ENU1_060540 [Entamoeba nuttalli P19]